MPWAARFLTAALVLIFLTLVLALFRGLLLPRADDSDPSVALGPMISFGLQHQPLQLVKVFLALALPPLAAFLLWRAKAAGHDLALLFTGWVTLEAGLLLLAPFSWLAFDPINGFQHLVSLVMFVVFALLFYLALRPEVFSYFQSRRP